MPSTSLRAAVLALALAGCGLARAAPPPAEPMLAYTVAPHDTLIGLNRTLLVSPRAWPEVARLNRLADPNRISPGQVLMVPTRLLQSREVRATIVAAFGDVRVAGSPAQVGTTVGVGDAIATGEAGSAVVQLADGSRIRLSPATEGRLDEHRRFRVKATRAAIDDGLVAGSLRLLRGSIEVFATKVLRARPLEVTTPTAVIGVRGTTYRVRNEVTPATPTTPPGNVSATEVLEGKVHVEVGAAGVDVPAGFGAPLVAGRPPVALPLLPAPDLAGVPGAFDVLPLRMRIAGDTPLRVQVAADVAFDHIAVDFRVGAGDELRIPALADGTWYLRVRRIGPDGLEGLDGVHAFELHARPQAPYLVEPVDGAKRSVGDVTLRWTENPEAASYRIEIARDAAFTQIALRTGGLHGATATFHPVGTAFGAPDGVYFWRVESERADGRAGPAGESQAFVLRPVPRAPLGDMSPDGSAVEIRWGGRPEDRVQVELARDPAFREIVDRGEFGAPLGRLARPAPGVVHARYRFIEPDGFRTEWSDGVRIEVDRSWHKALRALFEGPGR